MQMPCPRGRLIPGEGLEDARLARGLVADNDDGGERDALLHDLEVSELVDRVEQGADPVVIGGSEWRHVGNQQGFGFGFTADESSVVTHCLQPIEILFFSLYEFDRQDKI